jgi:enoyl-CoA hydratase/carnithine racemase
MGEYKLLKYHKDGQIGFIHIDHLTASRTVEMQLSRELEGICDDISADESILVLIVTGTREESFSYNVAHKELEFIGKDISAGLLPSISSPLSSLAIPVIAAIKGDAIDQGLELALACDFRIITKTARLGFPHISSGIMPHNGGTQRLPRFVGRGKAMEMLLTGDLVDAEEAYRIGLVNRVVNSEELLSVALELAQSMAVKGPIALRYAKEAVLKGMELTLDQGLHLEADLYCLLQTSMDRIEGIQAFREKRHPEFKGT